MERMESERDHFIPLSTQSYASILQLQKRSILDCDDAIGLFNGSNLIDIIDSEWIVLAKDDWSYLNAGT